MAVLFNDGGGALQADFWLQRWQEQLIGFHQDEVNPYLTEFWPSLGLPQGSRVLVPLCGKSLDLLWLADQGYAVVGVELSPLAVAAFFTENGLVANKTVRAGFEIWQSGSISLLCGDLFDLTAEDIGPIDAIYDRAALVALPQSMRQDYCRQLLRLCPGDVKSLLITLFYDQTQMTGPPFSVSPQEVQNLLSDNFDVNTLAQVDILQQNPKLREMRLTWFEEQVYLLRSRH